MKEETKKEEVKEVKTVQEKTLEKPETIGEKTSKMEKAKTVTEKPKKKSKKWLIALIIAIVVIIVAVGGFIAYHSSQLGLLTVEVAKMIEVDAENLKSTPIDKEIKTKGGYAVIEETMKNYLSDFYDVLISGPETIDLNALENIGSIQNIKEDGPDFIKTKAKIEETKQALTTYLTKIREKMDIEKFVNAIDDKDVSTYYKELYKDLVKGNDIEKNLTEVQETLGELEETEKEAIEQMDKVLKMLNFLSENKASWLVQNNQLLFKDMTKLKEYNQMVRDLQ